MKAKPATDLVWEPSTFVPAPPGLYAYYYEPSELVKLPEGYRESDEQDPVDRILGLPSVRELRALGGPPKGYTRTLERAIERPIVGYAVSNEDGRLHALTLDEQARVRAVVSFIGFERIGYRAPHVHLDVVSSTAARAR